jgi:ribose transport system permease protein
VTLLRRRLVGAQRRFPIVQLSAIVVLYVLGVIVIADFGGTASILAILVLSSFVAIAAAGQTFAVLLGGLDLAIPAVIGAANVAIAELTGGFGWPFAAASALILGVAFCLGAFNGFIAERFRIHPLVVTLAVATMVSGAIHVWTNGQTANPSPSYLGKLTSTAGHIGPVGIPPLVVITLAFTIVVIVVLHASVFGRRLYATGANPRAARLALVDTRRVWMLAYGASGACAALAGILLGGFTGTGFFAVGDPYLVSTITAVVIGGTSLFGGRGGYLNTVLGAVMLTEITTLLVAQGFDLPSQQMVLGALIVAVVATYARDPHPRSSI